MNRSKIAPYWIVAPGLLALAAISYGILISKMGFYWDDWTIAWYIRFLGPESFKEAFAFDRPLLASIYQLTTPIFGISPFNWQVFAIVARWLTAWTLWWAMDGIWPGKPVQTTAISLLFMLYPGFQQQHIAITYGNAFVVLTIYLLSWGLMIWGLRRQSLYKYFFPLSIVCALYAVFTAEHFFGLEFMRPVLIFLVIREKSAGKKSLGFSVMQTFKIWLPFLIIDSAFLIWRLFTPTPRAEITFFTRLLDNPTETILNLIKTMGQDVLETGAQSWLMVIRPTLFGQSSSAILRNHLLIIVAATIISGSLLVLVNRNSPSQGKLAESRKWGFRCMVIGLLALIVAGVPIWPTNLRITLFFPYDRFTLPSMFGAALILVGLIEASQLVRYQNIIIISLVCGLTAGFHYQNAINFRQDWLAQREFFWQMTWRMPAIKPGTVLLTSELPFKYDWDNSLTAPLNWNYAPEYKHQDLPYLIYDVEGPMSSGLPELESGSEIFEEHRITPFRGSTDQALVFFYRPPGRCLKVVMPEKDLYISEKPRYFDDIAEFSNPGFILPSDIEETEFLKRFFYPEPEPSWCSYFIRAERAYQEENWTEIVRLGDIALGNSPVFTRRNAYELLPFIEANLYTGKWKQALELTQSAVEAWDKLRFPICELYSEIQMDVEIHDQDVPMISQALEFLNCEVEH